MSEKSAWWKRRSLWLGILIASAVISIVVAVRLLLFWGQRPDPGPGSELKAAQAALDAATLTAVGALVTSVASLVAIVLSHARGQRELELERQMREQELELERAKLEIERMRVETAREDDS
jgi:hypothetical protein